LHLQAHKPQAKKATDKQVNVSFRASAFWPGVISFLLCFLATAPKKQNMDIKQANNMLRTMAFIMLNLLIKNRIRRLTTH